MSNTENTNIDAPTEDNLDDFAADLFGGSKAKPSDDATSEDVQEVEEVEDDALEDKDTHSAEDGATEDDSEETNTEEEDETEGAKPKNRFQERINELTAARREAERRQEETERKLNEVLKKLEESTPKPKDPEPTQGTESTLRAPVATDKNPDGTDKYPLGEFDPKFLQATVQHMLDVREAQQKQEAAKLQEQQELLRQREAAQEAWNEKLVDAQERYPDYQEKGQALLDSFSGIDEQYGQYLTDTIMEMDAGPDVFYYLANNPEEAKKIVDAGPRKATIALAKLEATFVSAPTETKVTPRKTTKAPTPPPQLKGSAVARASVPIDTDDLDAFTKALFKSKK